MMQRLAIVIATLALPQLAEAETRWHAGLNLRADLGTHPIRAGGGIQLEYVDLTLVLDPMFWTDGQHDIDALAFWAPCPRAWGLFGGWRTSTIAIVDGTQLHQKLLAGIGAPLPRLGPFHARWSFELATVIVKHGGGLPSDWISFASGRDFIDLVNFGMFVSLDYGKPI
ncbi:MAG TPA: hypothetical protein VIV11_32350 [Kofleriaceae bacterium]